MVVLLYVSHFCCPSFYGYSLKTLKLSEQSGFDDNGEGIEGPLLSHMRGKKSEQEKTAMGAGVGRRGRGREIFPLHFFSSVFFSSSHSPLYSTYMYI